MNKQQVISKGYTLSVTSWENDGDNYATNSTTFDSKELAVAVARMCMDLFQSINNSKSKGIGNTCDRSEATDLILEYMKKHPELYQDKNKTTDKDLIDICMEYNGDLLGGSEYYYSRVCESCSITYSPEDVYLETIDF